MRVNPWQTEQISQLAAVLFIFTITIDLCSVSLGRAARRRANRLSPVASPARRIRLSSLWGARRIYALPTIQARPVYALAIASARAHTRIVLERPFAKVVYLDVAVEVPYDERGLRVYRRPTANERSSQIALRLRARHRADIVRA